MESNIKCLLTKKVGRSVAIGLGFILFGFLLAPIALGQDFILTVPVLVNTQNLTGYNPNQQNPGEFQRFTERYLEHLQIPYEIVDVSSQSPPDLSRRQ